jgi:iron-sulfur cluster assembly accessory protein
MAKKDCGNVQKVFVPQKGEEGGITSPSPDSVSGILITDIAAEKIKYFVQSQSKSIDEYGLKISVVKDGCSGNSYTMDLSDIASAKQNQDKCFEKEGAIVMIDKLSYIFVIGSELDYVETLMMSGFQLSNPNVKKSCSCGSSFAI